MTEVAKILPVVRLAPHKLVLVCADAVVGVTLLATTLAGKHMATVLPNFLLARHLQRLESFSHTLQGLSLSLSYALSSHTDPIHQQHDFPHNPDLNICRSRCQQMSTPLLVFLKADPCLQGDVADDKADPLLCLQLKQIFVGRAPWTTNMCLNSLFSFFLFLRQWLHCSGKQGRVASSR